jgi:uncharacterized membrane protein YedE/YeeE
MRGLFAFLSGSLFGLGLTVSGMINPVKVIGFLDISGAWDPSLIFVIGGAFAVTSVAFQFVLQRPGPIMGGSFQLPSTRNVDHRLILGSAIFGVGWGLGGLCPGPAIASLAFLDGQTVAFVASMVIGSFAGRYVLSKKTVDTRSANKP